MTADDIHKAIQNGAKDIRQPGETPEQAEARFLRTAKGQDLYQQLRRVQLDQATTGPAQPLTASETSAIFRDTARLANGREPSADNVLTHVEEQAAERRRSSGFSMTQEQAQAKVLSERPELYDAYLHARAREQLASRR